MNKLIMVNKDFVENFEAEDGFEHDEFVYGNMSSSGYKIMCKVP